MNNYLNLIPSCDLPAWIGMWSACYSQSYKDKYYDEAYENLQTAEDNKSLHAGLIMAVGWKNNDKLDDRRRGMLRAIEIEDWKSWSTQREPPRIFQNGVVWNIFLLHLASGKRRPIFDRHTWRAFVQITGKSRGKSIELQSNSLDKQLEAYYEYETWFTEQLGPNVDARMLDRALMAFGQFLASQFSSLLPRLNAPSGLFNRSTIQPSD